MYDKIAVVVIFFNKLEQTIACIESFLFSGVSVFVLNNGSDRASYERLKKKFSGCKVFFFNSDSNLGPSKGRNFLIQKVEYEWLFFIDNDITVKNRESWLKNFEEIIEEDVKYDAYIPKLFNIHEGQYAGRFNLYLDARNLRSKQLTSGLINNFPGGAVIVNRSVFFRYGMYDEKMFAFEDFEFGIRALLSLENPLRCLCIDDIELIHDHKYQRKDIDKNAVRQRYDNSRLRDSFIYLRAKHGINYDHSWEMWSNNQVKLMTNLPYFQFVKNVFKAFIKKK